MVKIDQNGMIDDHYVTLAGEKTALPEEYSRAVPNWNTIVETVTKGALCLNHFAILGWDVTVDSQGNVIVIECNIREPGTIVYQFAHGPLAGENTDRFLSFMTKDENLKLIPKCIRL